MDGCFIYPVIVLVSLCMGFVSGGGMFSECGATLKGPRGTIQSPNFPRAFPTPISCRWIIHAPEHSKIIIYFTQYFLRHSFHVTEYEDYKDSETKNVLGPFNAQEAITSLEVYRPYVVLDLMVTDDANLNLRVEDFLMEVHGFNITYEIVPKEQETKDSCSVHECSYLGNCLASIDYSTYSCSCFDGFYGNGCEKGPYCDPDKGMNTCINGGKCRYFLGSKVLYCDCPSGYKGDKCDEVAGLKEECPKNHSCTHQCVRSPTGVPQCKCKDGFRLEPDGISCKELERYRIIVNMPVLEQEDIDDKIQTFRNKEQDNIINSVIIFQFAGLTSPERFEMDSISNESVAYHFFVNKTELGRVDQAVTYLIGGNLFYGITIDMERMTVKKEPETKILSVENNDKGPALEGKLLTLTCVARGSDNLRFRWFKDGKTFDMSLTHRNAWEIRLPETIGKKQISVLNIDGVTMYDKGRFTCMVSDFGLVLSNSVDLDVMLYPQVEVTPLTISALQGQAQSFRCLSPDDNKPSFTYSWLKNNRPVRSSDEEEVEDLQPSGSRLLIKRAKVTANYSCQVTNRAGTASRTVYLFVPNANKSVQGCELNMKDGIKWNKTLAGFFNMQKCPIDHNAQAGEESWNQKSHRNFLSRIGGTTKRQCVCTRSSCKWMKPNYSGCQSVLLIKIFHHVMKIKQGYQDYPLDKIYRQLYQIAHKARGRMLAGDLDITATILYMILTTARDFPSLTNSSFGLYEIVDFLNIVLEETQSMTDDEKEDLQTGGKLVHIIEVLTELHNRKLIKLTNTEAPNIAIRVWNIQRQYGEPKSQTTRNSIYRTKRSVKLEGHQKVKENVRTEVLSAQYDKSILSLLDFKNRNGLKKEQFLSDVISVVPLARKWTKGSKYYLVEISHQSGAQEHLLRKSTNVCYSWERDTRESTDGQWEMKSCYMIETFTNLTRCACLIPGHFTVVTVPANKTVVSSSPGDSVHVLLVTCILSMCCIGIGMAVYLVAWKYVKHVKHSIHLNFLLSLFGLNATCLACLLKPDIEVMCVSSKILLQLFTVAAFTFLFLDGVQLFAGVHITLHALISKGCCKFTIIGWGVPALSVVCVAFMMELIGFDKHCDHWCFWNYHHHHFFSVLIPIAILIMCHTIVSLLCILVIIKWNGDYHYRKRWKMMMEYARSEFLLILLIILVSVGTVNTRNKSIGAQVVFLIFDLLLVVSSVLLFCIIKKPMRLSLQHLFCCSLHLLIKEDLPVFHNILPPADQEERVRAEEEQIHEYCDRVDQERYTNKHKRQLRFLLNSSSSSSSSGACCSGGSENSQSKDNWAPRVNRSVNNADSGISEGTESEKSLSQVQEEGGDSSVPFDENQTSQKQSCKKTQNSKRSGKGTKSKSKHKASTSREGEEESQGVCSKSSTQTSAIDMEVGEETPEAMEKKRSEETSSFLTGLKYSGKVKSMNEVHCLLDDEGEQSSQL